MPFSLLLSGIRRVTVCPFLHAADLAPRDSSLWRVGDGHLPFLFGVYVRLTTVGQTLVAIRSPRPAGCTQEQISEDIRLAISIDLSLPLS